MTCLHPINDIAIPKKQIRWITFYFHPSTSSTFRTPHGKKQLIGLSTDRIVIEEPHISNSSRHKICLLLKLKQIHCYTCNVRYCKYTIFLKQSHRIRIKLCLFLTQLQDNHFETFDTPSQTGVESHSKSANRNIGNGISISAKAKNG